MNEYPTGVWFGLAGIVFFICYFIFASKIYQHTDQWTMNKYDSWAAVVMVILVSGMFLTTF